jgi:hypothetical protein
MFPFSLCVLCALCGDCFLILLQFEPSISSRNFFGESIANKFIVLLSWSVGIRAADQLSELLLISALTPISRPAISVS